MDRIAIEELSSLNLLPDSPAPIRIDRFVEKRFKLSGVIYEDLPANVLGYTEFSDCEVKSIYITKALAEDGTRHAERRISSTIAHEAGHGLLHRHLFTTANFAKDFFESDDDVTPVKILCRDGPDAQSQPRYDGRWWEYQANHMIGCLLMPKPLVLAALRPFLSAEGILAVHTVRDEDRTRAVKELSDLFDVNRPVAKLRLATLCPTLSTDQLTL